MAGDDDVVLEGLRRWDAVVLIALATRSGPPRSWPMRVYAVLRYGSAAGFGAWSSAASSSPDGR